MKEQVRFKWFPCMLFCGFTLMSGCAAFRQNVSDVDPNEASTLTAKFDQRDLRDMVSQIAADIVAHPFPPEGTVPIMASLGINNNTKTHLDVVALEDTLVSVLMNTGKMQFINTSRRDDLIKEQGYQLANATESTRVQIGKQLGARYMITGAITELGARSGRQVRVSKQEDVYYQLTVDITDLETGLIVARKQRDRLRRRRSPLFGW